MGQPNSAAPIVTPATDELDLLEGWFLTEREQVWMSHGDHVSDIAPGFKVYGTSPNAPFAITGDPDRAFLCGAVPPRGAPHPERRDGSMKISCVWPVSRATGR